jgi:hypothetical protein
MKDAAFWGVTPCILAFTNIAEEPTVFVSRVCSDFVQVISVIIIPPFSGKVVQIPCIMS